MEGEREMVFTSLALVKIRKFQKYSENPTPGLYSQAISFLGFLSSKGLCSHPAWWAGVLAFQAEHTLHALLRGDLQSSPPNQLWCFPKQEVQSLSEDVSYLGSALDEDASFTALLRAMGREVNLLLSQGRGTRKLSEESKMKVEGKWSKQVIK